MTKMPQAYVLHCKTLVQRRQHMLSTCDKMGINIKWITDHDAVELTDDIISSFYEPNNQEAERRVNEIWGGNGHQDRQLGSGEISIAIKHTLAMQKIAAGSDDHALILEDDCLFVSNFVDAYEDYITKTPEDWDVIHVGDGYGMKPVNYQSCHSQIAYKMNHPASRCAEAILVKRDAAKKIASTMQPFCMAADWELAWQYYTHSLNVYWWQPPLITQGSHMGVFKSSLTIDRKG